ncbi:MAG: purine-nucleoside phosphorylase [Planctomycetota bacterium]|jgi:purine-nucleoside phosphorylase
MPPSALDDSVYSASKELRGRGAPDPDVLFLMATGVGLLPTVYRAGWQLPLESISGIPRAWRSKTLLAAENENGSFWFLEDAPSEEQFPSSGAMAAEDAAWIKAFPIWLAACSGASLCVHTSAGSALEDGAAGLRPGTLAIATDHINLSGRSPLFALGESRLGPLFPDQSQLHHRGLRRLAMSHAKRLGLAVSEGVAAASSGPAIETSAERRYFARAGADYSVQTLADPMIAMAHAGISCLAVTALIGDEYAARDIGGMIERADELAPSLDELLEALGPDLGKVALELREDI